MSNFAEGFDRAPSGADFAPDFDSTVATDMQSPVPAGQYTARAVSGACGYSKNKVPFYEIRLEIVSGEHAGRRLVARWYLSPKALAHSKPELVLLGLETLAQLRRGEVPAGLLAVYVALHTSDSGLTYSEVKRVLPQKTKVAAATPTATPPPREAQKTLAALAAPPPVAAISASSPLPSNAPPVTPADLSADLVDNNLI